MRRGPRARAPAGSATPPATASPGARSKPGSAGRLAQHRPEGQLDVPRGQALEIRTRVPAPEWPACSVVSRQQLRPKRLVGVPHPRGPNLERATADDDLAQLAGLVTTATAAAAAVRVVRPPRKVRDFLVQRAHQHPPRTLTRQGDPAFAARPPCPPPCGTWYADTGVLRLPPRRGVPMSWISESVRRLTFHPSQHHLLPLRAPVPRP